MKAEVRSDDAPGFGFAAYGADDRQAVRNAETIYNLPARSESDQHPIST